MLDLLLLCLDGSAPPEDGELLSTFVLVIAYEEIIVTALLEFVESILVFVRVFWISSKI